MDNASPVDRVDLDSPAVYLACGETVGFPLDFGCQTDHEAMHDVLVAEASPPVAALDDTRDDNGTHYSIDWHLDLPALQSFLDGLR